MTTIIQKMWRDGVPGPDGGLVRIAERREDAPTFSTYKCSWCDRLSTVLTEGEAPLCACGLLLLNGERL